MTVKEMLEAVVELGKLINDVTDSQFEYLELDEVGEHGVRVAQEEAGYRGSYIEVHYIRRYQLEEAHAARQAASCDLCKGTERIEYKEGDKIFANQPCLRCAKGTPDA